MLAPHEAPPAAELEAGVELVLEGGSKGGFPAQPRATGVSRLDQEVRDHAVEHAAIVVALQAQLHEVAHGLRTSSRACRLRPAGAGGVAMACNSSSRDFCMIRQRLLLLLAWGVQLPNRTVVAGQVQLACSVAEHQRHTGVPDERDQRA